jgi:hypothetical protein
MRDVVLKYAVPTPNEQGRSYIDLHLDSELLSVAIQDEQMVVWARVGAPFEGFRDTKRWRLIVLNTGQEVEPFTGRFLGTVTSHGVVWHVWDGGPRV